MTLCNIEVIKGHKVGCFTDNGDASCDYLTTGFRTVGIYLYETACGTFTAMGIAGKDQDALFIMEAAKTRILRV